MGNVVKLGALAAVSFCTAVQIAEARTWYLEPSLTLSVGFDENPRLVTDSVVSSLSELEIDSGTETQSVAVEESESTIEAPLDVIYSVIGAELQFSTNSGADSIEAVLGASAAIYSDSVLDSERIESRIEYEKTGLRTDYSALASYVIDSSFQAELLDTGVTVLDSERRELAVSPGVTRRFNDNVTGSFSYNVSDVEFSGDSTSFVDYVEHTVLAEISQSLTERLSLSYSAEASFYRPGQSTSDTPIADEDITRLRIGVESRLTETLTATVLVGPTFTERTGPGIESIDAENIDFSVEFAYIGQRNNFTLQLSNDQEITALGGSTEANRIEFGWTREQTLGGRFVFSIGYLDRNGTLTVADLESITLSPALVLPINQNNTLTVRYERTEQESGAIGDLAEQSVSNNSYLLAWEHVFQRKRLGD